MELRDIITTGDAWRTERLAHTLKGAVGSFAAHAAYSLVSDLERQGRQGELGNASAVLQQLERELDRIVAFMQHLSPEDDS